MGVSKVEKPWTVSVRDSNHSRLLKIKEPRETLDEVIGRLLDFYENSSEKKEDSRSPPPSKETGQTTYQHHDEEVN